MKNKLNEASIKVDVQGLESSDFETLSRMLALAGQAESDGGMNPGFSELPKMEPFDFDSAGAEETSPIMSPDGALEPEIGSSPDAMDGMGELDAAVDDLAGTVTDFGAGAEDDEVSLDLDGQPELESDVEFEDDFGDSEFDMDRMSSLAGISESLESDEDEAADAEVEEDDALETAEEDAVKESLLPDLSLDEDAEAVNEEHGRDFGDDHHKVGSPEHGPFSTHREAVHDAMRKTDGTEFEHFAVIQGKDGYYWRENTQPVHEEEGRDFGDDHHAVDSKEHGPFRTEREAVHDAMKVTNGTEFEHFAVIPGKDGYYWRRNIQEELDNEPEPCMVDMDGIENSRHAFKRQPGTALGDNGLRESEFSVEDNPETEDEDEEDVEDILESINARYNAFLKGL